MTMGTSGKSLFDKIRRIEAGDSRGRKMHATTSQNGYRPWRTANGLKRGPDFQLAGWG